MRILTRVFHISPLFASLLAAGAVMLLVILLFRTRRSSTADHIDWLKG